MKKIDYKIIGNNIKQKRLQAGITQAELAEKIDVNTSHISNVENNYTKPSLQVLLDIANALDTTLDFLLQDQYDNQKISLNSELVHKITSLNPSQKKLLNHIIDAIIEC